MSREHAGAGTEKGTLLIATRAPRRHAPLLALALAFALTGCGRATPRNAGAEAARAAQASAAPAAPDTAGLPEVVPVTADDLRRIVDQSDARAVVLNVWATWCGPCREEFPDLVRLGRDYRDRGVRLVLVSGDFDDELGAAREFLAAHGVEFRTYIKTGSDMAFIDGLNPEWSGALPATFIYDRGGRRRDYWQGKATYDQMRRHLDAVLAATGEAHP